MYFKFLWNGKCRQQDIFFQIQYGNLICNFICIINSLGKITEYLFHFPGIFEIKLVVGKCKSFIPNNYIIICKFTRSGSGKFFACINTKKNIMCSKVALVYIM